LVFDRLARSISGSTPKFVQAALRKVLDCSPSNGGGIGERRFAVALTGRRGRDKALFPRGSEDIFGKARPSKSQISATVHAGFYHFPHLK
jgi:hypothetical protein